MVLEGGREGGRKGGEGRRGEERGGDVKGGRVCSGVWFILGVGGWGSGDRSCIRLQIQSSFFNFRNEGFTLGNMLHFYFERTMNDLLMLRGVWWIAIARLTSSTSSTLLD